MKTSCNIMFLSVKLSLWPYQMMLNQSNSSTVTVRLVKEFSCERCRSHHFALLLLVATSPLSLLTVDNIVVWPLQALSGFFLL